MIRNLSRVALLLLGLGAPLAAWRAGTIDQVPESPALRPPAGPSLLSADSRDPGGLTRLAQTRTPFRLGGLPPANRYGATPVVPPSEVPRQPRPALVLTGILWGAEPAAIVEGIPGRDGPVVLRSGDVAGPIRVESISESRVVLAGMDTIWTLAVREPWR